MENGRKERRQAQGFSPGSEAQFFPPFAIYHFPFAIRTGTGHRA